MSNSNQWISALKGIIGEPNVIQDPDRLKAYAVDGLAPKAVVIPGSVEEVSRLLAYASLEKLAVVPRGNGTKMAAGGIPLKVDLVLSMLRINRITEHDIPNLSLSVEAGITLAEVQKKLAGAGKGSFLPLDPPYSEQATIGGIIATNSSGPRRYLYSSARDLLLGLKAVSPNGDLVAFGGKTVKNVSGYDMTKLMIGSWGALGVITEITTKLLPLPEASATLLASFGDLAKAGSLTRKILHSVLLPSAMELMDGRAAGQLGEKARYLVAFSLEGVGEAVERQVAEIGEMAEREGAIDTKVLKGEDDRTFWLRVRNFALASTASVILRSNVVISKLTEILGKYETMAHGAGIGCALIGHAGNGILTIYILDRDVAEMGPVADLIGKFTDEAAKHEGNLIVESSPRDLKEKVSVWGRPRSDEVVMRRLKETVDPGGVLNPGRFVGGV
ncbi:MAG: FAD-binding oxidoreductase [Proteobacteria bacterium]|nr:FAD-binding oxidoreductase [Pseudomonadota bacterium]MBU1965244.1 FAD-binding oxidoreductase [Pseudomonadota bacterium]